MSGAESPFGALFEMLGKAESLDPEVRYHEDRGRTYEALADELTDTQARQLKLIAAVEAYDDALCTGSAEVHAFAARVLLNKALLAQEFTDNNFDSIKQRLRPALARYTEIVVRNLRCTWFPYWAILHFPKKTGGILYCRTKLANLLITLAKREPMVYLTSADTPVKVLDRDDEEEAPVTEQARGHCAASQRIAR